MTDRIANRLAELGIELPQPAAPVAAYVPAVPYAVYPSRPPWAAPWQCFTDEGYGRFRPCDAGPSSIR